MPLTDYSEIAERLQRVLARNHEELVNRPGGLAHKLDPDIYLVVWPNFVEKLAHLAGVHPEKAAQCLIRTGQLASKQRKDAQQGKRVSALRLKVIPSPKAAARDIAAGFLAAEFVERALALYAEDGPVRPGLSPLRIAAAERPRVEAFFGDCTPPSSLAYA